MIKNKVRVKNIYPIKDLGQLYIHLDTVEWDFKHFGLVNLCIDNHKFLMKYFGYGNHNGNPVISLIFLNPKKSIDVFNDIDGKEIYVERVDE